MKITQPHHDPLLEQLRLFNEAAQALTRQWSLTEDDANHPIVMVERYPFDESFDQIARQIHEWYEAAVNYQPTDYESLLATRATQYNTTAIHKPNRTAVKHKVPALQPSMNSSSISLSKKTDEGLLKMKLETTWNEHGKIWHYFTTSREAKAARVEGVVLNPALGVWRSIAAYACKSCGTETNTHTPDCERAPATKETVLELE